ncbi:hypothetical protein MRX96_049039 [Rhipicephalus microplus]
MTLRSHAQTTRTRGFTERAPSAKICRNASARCPSAALGPSENRQGARQRQKLQGRGEEDEESIGLPSPWRKRVDPDLLPQRREGCHRVYIHTAYTSTPPLENKRTTVDGEEDTVLLKGPPGPSDRRETVRRPPRPECQTRTLDLCSCERQRRTGRRPSPRGRRAARRKWVSGAHRPADDDANERRRQTRCALSSGKQHRCSAPVAATMRNAVATFALLLVLGATAWAEDEKDKEGLGYVMAFPMEEPKPSGGRVETVVVESSKAEDLRQVLGAYKAATRLRQRQQQQPPQPLPPPMQRMPPPDQKPPLLLLVVHAPRPSGPGPFRAGPPMPGPPPGFLQGPPPAPHPGMNPYAMLPAPPVGPAQVQMPAPPTAHPPRSHAPPVVTQRANNGPRDNGPGMHFAIVQEPYIVNTVMHAPSMMRPAFIPGPALFSGPPSPPPSLPHPMIHGGHPMMHPHHMMHHDSPIMMRGPPMSHGPQMMHSPSMMVPVPAFLPAPPMIPPFMMHGPPMMPGGPMMHGPPMMPSPAAMMYGHMGRPRVGQVVVMPVAVLLAERPEPQREAPREKPTPPPPSQPSTPQPATRRMTTMERLGVNYAPEEEDDDELSPMATIRAANTVLRMLMSS